MTTAEACNLTRNEVMKRIKAALKRRSGKEWSVRGGKGTAYGWLTIDVLPKRRTWQWVEASEQDEFGSPTYIEVDDPSREFGHMGPADRQELGELLGLDCCHFQGQMVPAGSASYAEFIDRAEGREPSVYGQRNWD